MIEFDDSFEDEKAACEQDIEAITKQLEKQLKDQQTQNKEKRERTKNGTPSPNPSKRSKVILN